MTARVVDLTQHARRAARKNGHEHCAIPPPAHVHDWDVDLVATLTCQSDQFPTTTAVRWQIDVDPVRRRWEVSVWREGWQHCHTFQGSGGSAMRLLNELLAASFGVPA